MRVRLYLGLAFIGTTCLALAAPAQPDKEKAGVLKGFGIRTMCFSPDGTRLAIALGEPKRTGRVVLWHTKTDKPVWIHDEPLGVPGVAYSPAGKTIAIGLYDHSAKLLDAADGHVLKTFHGHKHFVHRVTFSPDGKTLATGGWDQSVKLWSLETGEIQRTLAFPSVGLVSLSFSANGQWLLASGRVLRVWEAATGKEQRALGDDRANSTNEALFVDDRHFLAGDYHSAVRLWSIADGEQVVRLRTHYASRIAFSPTGRLLAVSSHMERPVRLFDFTLQPPAEDLKKQFQSLLVKLDDDDYQTREAAGREVLKLGFAVEPELRRLMKNSPSAELRIRCRRLHEELLSKPRSTLSEQTESVDSLAFSPDGRLLATGDRQGTVAIWDISANKQITRFVPSAIKE